jgi:hypothetical protein
MEGFPRKETDLKEAQVLTLNDHVRQMSAKSTSV